MTEKFKWIEEGGMHYKRLTLHRVEQSSAIIWPDKSSFVAMYPDKVITVGHHGSFLLYDQKSFQRIGTAMEFVDKKIDKLNGVNV